MATPGINTKVKMDGEKEYRAALAQINAGLKNLGAEMRSVEQDFSDNADSVGALSAKNDVLSRQIDTQKEKVETLREVLQRAGETYGEADKRTIDWKTTLLDAETKLKQMQQALDENNEELDKAGANGTKFQQAMEKIKDSVAKAKEEGTGAKGVFSNLKEAFGESKGEAVGLGDAIGSAADKLGIQLPEGASKALNSLNGISAGTAAAVGGFAAVAAAIVKAEKKLMDITQESASAAKEIRTLASVTGQSAEEVQELQYAGDMIGVSYDRIRDSLKEVTNKMQEARDGNEATAAAYARLGVAITDANGNLRNAEDVFYDTIDALGQMENRTERDALAMDLMSESAQELNPLIIQGSDTLREYAQEAHDVGYVLDNETLDSLGAVDDGFQRLQKTQEAVKNQMAAEFAPYLTDFYEKITKLIKDGGQAMKESGLVDAFGMLLETVGNIIAPTDALANGAVPNLTKALRPLSEVVATIADTLQVISGLVTLATTPLWHFDKWASGFTKIGTGLGMNKNQPSNLQRLWAQWEGTDTNAATNAAGYGAYYANGKYYGNRDAYLREQWEAELNSGGVVGSFEAWKQAMGYARNASGADWFIGGPTLLGEHGAETAILPQGTRILTAQETRQSGGDTYNITIDAKSVREFEDILRIAQERRRVIRMGGATG